MVSNVTFSVFDFHTSTAPPAHLLTRDLHWGVSPQTSTSQIQQVTFHPNVMLLQGFLVSVTTINLVSQAKSIGIISYCFFFFLSLIFYIYQSPNSRIPPEKYISYPWPHGHSHGWPWFLQQLSTWVPCIHFGPAPKFTPQIVATVLY